MSRNAEQFSFPTPASSDEKNPLGGLSTEVLNQGQRETALEQLKQLEQSETHEPVVVEGKDRSENSPQEKGDGFNRDRIEFTTKPNEGHESAKGASEDVDAEPVVPTHAFRPGKHHRTEAEVAANDSEPKEQRKQPGITYVGFLDDAKYAWFSLRETGAGTRRLELVSSDDPNFSFESKIFAGSNAEAKFEEVRSALHLMYMEAYSTVTAQWREKIVSSLRTLIEKRARLDALMAEYAQASHELSLRSRIVRFFHFDRDDKPEDLSVLAGSIGALNLEIETERSELYQLCRSANEAYLKEENTVQGKNNPSEVPAVQEIPEEVAAISVAEELPIATTEMAPNIVSEAIDKEPRSEKILEEEKLSGQDETVVLSQLVGDMESVAATHLESEKEVILTVQDGDQSSNETPAEPVAEMPKKRRSRRGRAQKGTSIETISGEQKEKAPRKRRSKSGEKSKEVVDPFLLQPGSEEPLRELKLDLIKALPNTDLMRKVILGREGLTLSELHGAGYPETLEDFLDATEAKVKAAGIELHSEWSLENFLTVAANCLAREAREQGVNTLTEAANDNNADAEISIEKAA